MTTETMRVHNALAELKTLDDRIAKLIRSDKWVIHNKHSNTKIGGEEISAYLDAVKSRYQKVNDLIKRREAIKKAVIKSNAVTEINVGGETHTVAEAIEIKNNGVRLWQILINRLTSDLESAKMMADRENERLESRADDYIKSLTGNSDLKGMGDEVKRMREDFIKAQTVELVDPIKVYEEIERLSEKITVFLTEVDGALSVSNAITEITIEY